MTGKKWPIALIGLGRAGARHLAAIRRAARLELACVVETDPVLRVSSAHGIPVFDTLERALGSTELSAAIIATPPGTHADLAIEAMHRGLDVLVEKPMALTVADCDRMLEVEASTDRVLMVGHTYHFDPVMRRAGELIEKGDLGRPIWLFEQSVRPRPEGQPAWMDSPESGGLLMSNGVHLIDRTAWLLQEWPTAVNSVVRRPLAAEGSGDAWELDCVTLAFDSGTVASLLLGQPQGGPSVRIAEAVFTSGRMRYADDLEVSAGDEWTRIPVDSVDPFESQLEAFATAIDTRRADPDGRWGRRVVQVATLARREGSPADMVREPAG